MKNNQNSKWNFHQQRKNEIEELQNEEILRSLVTNEQNEEDINAKKIRIEVTIKDVTINEE